MKHYLFTPIDSWFFRESRSMDGGGSTAIKSIFPPATQTLLGAIRTQIGEKYFDEHGGNWRSFNEQHPLTQHIGYGKDNYANLKAQGVWLYHANQCYFPAPANLVQQTTCENKEAKYDYFALSEHPIETDLGKIYLPTLKPREKNAKNIEQRDQPIEDHWISTEDYQRVLNGEPPKNLQKLSDLITIDTRLGIGRNNQTRRTEEGLLYQTQHIRLKDGWQLYLGIEGIDDTFAPTTTTTRLGGEGRMAKLTILDPAPTKLERPIAKNTDLVIYLLTPQLDQRENANTPPLPNGEWTHDKDPGYWKGKIAGINVQIISAIVGKPLRIGGWDTAKHQSSPVQSYLPAGSCWYIRCQTQAEAQQLIDNHHLQHLSHDNERAKGYGQIAIGNRPH